MEQRFEAFSKQKRKFYFFKIMIGEFSKHLMIPPAFLKHIECEDSNKAILESPVGKHWHLTLERTTDGLILEKGWKEFAITHSLQFGDFLVFRYNGDLHFTVKIFDRTACEREYLFDVGNGEHEFFFEENREEENSNKEQVQHLHVPLCKDPKAKIERKKETHASKNVHFPTKNVFFKRKYEREAIEEHVRDEKRSIPQSSSSDLISKVKGVGNRDNCQLGIEDERARAFEAATSLKLSNPCFRLVMKRSHVYVGFFLNIPIEFVRNYCPLRSQNIILRDEHGRRWPVRYIFKERGFLSGGWRGFTLTNNLKEGDACVFEIFYGKEIGFYVHTFRVSDFYKHRRISPSPE